MDHGLLPSSLVHPPKNISEQWVLCRIDCVNVILVIEASIMSEAQIQQRTMQLSQFVNKIQVVDSFPYLVDRLTVCLLHDDEFRLYFSWLGPWIPSEGLWNWQPQMSMVATSFAVVKWDGPLMGVSDDLLAVLKPDEENSNKRLSYVLHGSHLLKWGKYDSVIYRNTHTAILVNP